MAEMRRRNRSEELAAAAIEVFYEKGYRSASMQDIADRVGLLKGSVYHYTDSKEALLARIFESSTERTFALLEQIDRPGEPAIERIGAFVRSWSTWYLENLPTIAIYLEEWKHLSGPRLAQAVATRREAFRRVARLLDEAKREGAADAELNSRYAALLILSAINGLPGWYRSDQGQPEAIAAAYAELLVGMVRGAPGTAAPPPARLDELIEVLPTIDSSDAGEQPAALVMRAAIDVFHEKGYSGASMREVAERTNMNKGSLYHYIESKEGLLAAILAESTDRTFALLAEIERLPAPAIERFSAFVACWSRWYLLNPKVIGVYLDDWKHLSGERLEAAVATRREAFRRVARLLDEARREGAAVADSRYASLLTLSAINGLPSWFRPGRGDPPETIAAVYAGLLVGMVSKPKRRK